jgi:plasmid maintenance system antidote protein VapI
MKTLKHGQITELAGWLGISRGYLSAILARTKYPGRTTLRKLKNASGVGYDAWLDLNSEALAEVLLHAYKTKPTENN